MSPTADAAAPPVRRASIGWLAALLAYLLAAPGIFVFGPLAAFLLASGPRTVRAWAWTVGAAAWAGLWIVGTGGVASQLLRAAGVWVTGAALMAALWSPMSPARRALLVVGGTAAAVALWCLRLGIGWTEVRADVARAVTTQLSAAAQEYATGGSEVSRQASELLFQAAGEGRALADLFPAATVLAIVVGLALAWRGQRLLADRPLEPAPGRFADFRFSDQAVWLPVLGLALALAPLPPDPLRSALASNLLVLAAALYLVRGAAVMRATVGRVPLPLAVAAGILVTVFLAFVLAGLAVLGLADTWVDFRRRLASPSTGGIDP